MDTTMRYYSGSRVEGHGDLVRKVKNGDIWEYCMAFSGY